MQRQMRSFTLLGALRLLGAGSACMVTPFGLEDAASIGGAGRALTFSSDRAPSLVFLGSFLLRYKGITTMSKMGA